jgi:hypothetical protein
MRAWENNINMNLKEKGSEDGNCIQLARDKNEWRALVNMVLIFYMHVRQGVLLADLMVSSVKRLHSTEAVSMLFQPHVVRAWVQFVE